MEALRSATRILITTHKNPDGDALGSAAAFGRIAQSLGKEVRIFCETPTPDHLEWLPMPAKLVHSMEELGDWHFDTLTVLDCADQYRAGPEMAELLTAPFAERKYRILCIDHHTGNPLYGDENWVDPNYCATGAIIGELARSLRIPLAGALGKALYLAVASDTGSFSYANTNAQALHLAAEIVDNGLSVSEFTQEYEYNWSLARMRLWGQLMNEIRLECDGAIVVSVVTAAHLEQYGLKPNALEDYASWLRRLAGVKVVLFARTAKHGTKISLRSMGDVNVQAVAARFGGGGHIAAAGIDMPGEPGEAAARILPVLSEQVLAGT